MFTHSERAVNEPSPHWLLASRVSLAIAAIGIGLVGGMLLVFRLEFQRLEDFETELPAAVVRLIRTPLLVWLLIVISALAALIAKEFLPLKRQVTTAINCVMLAVVYVTGSVLWILLLQLWFNLKEAMGLP